MSNRFLTKQIDRRTQDGRNDILLSDLIYLSKSGILYRAPKGTETDGISTPKELWPALAPFGKEILPNVWAGWRSGVLHDSGYRRQLQMFAGAWDGDYADLAKDESWKDCDLSQAECDSLIREAILSEGLSELDATLIFDALTRFGGKAYREDREILKPIA